MTAARRSKNLCPLFGKDEETPAPDNVPAPVCYHCAGYVLGECKQEYKSFSLRPGGRWTDAENAANLG